VGQSYIAKSPPFPDRKIGVFLSNPPRKSEHGDGDSFPRREGNDNRAQRPRGGPPPAHRPVADPLAFIPRRVGRAGGINLMPRSISKANQPATKEEANGGKQG